MIIKLKNGGKRQLTKLRDYFIGTEDECLFFRIDPDKLNNILYYLKQNNINVFEIKLEESDEFFCFYRITHPSDYYEFILRDELEKLRAHHNIDLFFKEINFNDSKTYKLVYEKLTNFLSEGGTNKDKEFRINATSLNDFLIDLYMKEGKIKELNKTQQLLASTLRNWLDLYHPNYKKYFKSGIRYYAFFEVLLKYTGYLY